MVDGNDPAAVYEVMQHAIERARSGQGPSLIEAKLTRLRGHFVGDQQTYRADAEQALGRDPLPRLERGLRDAGVLDAATLAELEADIERQIDAAVETVKAAPLLAPEVALQDLYAEG